MKDKDIEFTFNDFNDYTKELADIKAVYDDLMKDEEIQKLLRLKKQQEVIDKVYELIKQHIRKDGFLELNEWQTRELIDMLKAVS